MPKFHIQTVSTFVHSYVIDADDEETAKSIVNRGCPDDYYQEHLGEAIVNSRQLKKKEVKALRASHILPGINDFHSLRKKRLDQLSKEDKAALARYEAAQAAPRKQTAYPNIFGDED